MKKQPRTMKNHENRPGTIKTDQEPWKTNLKPWKIMKTHPEPWKTIKNLIWDRWAKWSFFVTDTQNLPIIYRSSIIITATLIVVNFTILRENKRQRDANNTTLMLIVVISVFLAVELPLMVMSALHTINSRWDDSFSLWKLLIYRSMGLDFIDYDIANTVTMFINTCIFLSYPINFGIYCGMSR